MNKQKLLEELRREAAAWVEHGKLNRGTNMDIWHDGIALGFTNAITIVEGMPETEVAK